MPLFTWLAVLPAVAAGRIGLIIGNDNYEHVAQLRNAANDARLVAGAMAKLGFEHTLLLNAGRADILRAVAQVSAKTRPDDVVFLYYAGHGVQFAGENYLVPTDARIDQPEDLPERTVSVTRMFEAFDHQSRNASVIVLDACRDNPFAEAFKVARARGLAREPAGGDEAGGTSTPARPIDYTARGLVQPAKVPGNTMIAFATAPGQVALDGEGANSPFAAALAKELLEEGLEITSVLRNVAFAVKGSTNFRQEPWITWSLNGPVVLKPRKRESVSAF